MASSDVAYSSVNTPNPSPRTSGLAIAAFVVSLLQCIPLLASTVGLVLTALAFRSIKNNNLAGRGFAIAALVLSLVGLVGWLAIGLTSLQAYRSASAVSQNTARPFLTALLNSDQTTAAKFLHPQFPRASLTEISEYSTTNYGTLQSLTTAGGSVKATLAGTEFHLNYTATFTTGKSTFVTITILRTPTGDVVTHVHIR